MVVGDLQIGDEKVTLNHLVGFLLAELEEFFLVILCAKRLEPRFPDSFFFKLKFGQTGMNSHTHTNLAQKKRWTSGYQDTIFRSKEDVFVQDTPLKFNMEPENQPLEKEIPFRNHHFQVPC